MKLINKTFAIIDLENMANQNVFSACYTVAPVAFQIEWCPNPLKPSTLVSGGATVAQLVWCQWCPLKIKLCQGTTGTTTNGATE